ncbi:OsmC family protein [Desulfovibrio sp. OttesenSCG-928-F07]|nr:OsmC family protein [Desulfovibrio sp. OttesenSCG-928-F07]
MPTSTIRFTGPMQMECTHSRNGAKIMVEPAPENGGSDQAFSPTDLLCTSMACCSMGILGVYACTHGLDLSNMTAEVTKVKSSDPKAHRLGAIELVFNMPPQEYSEKHKISLQRALETCVVKRSIHPEVEQRVIFNWP